ncbi:FRG domain-containing protein [Tundrisphaera lichenicola]|uniref:FRG domain-containing protein n=1 Tax=Tundrisphaera lichenicola TaxID=2029860 RepID=UPI003EBB39E1
MEVFELKDWHDLLNIADLLEIGSATRPPFVFRGQPCSKWQLKPSLLRHLERLVIDSAQAIQLEKTALDEFRAEAHYHISPIIFMSAKNHFDWWAIMQHYGAPTRLLDWTASIFVAAYFAVSGYPDEDGAIFLVNSLKSNIATIKKHPNISGIDGVANQLFDAMLVQPNAPSTIHFMGQHLRNDRMSAQQGLFSISPNIFADHSSILNSHMSDTAEQIEEELNPEISFGKLVVPVSLKAQYLRKLKNMNITANSLFPGIDGLGRSVAELFLLGKSGFGIV